MGFLPFRSKKFLLTFVVDPGGLYQVHTINGFAFGFDRPQFDLKIREAGPPAPSMDPPLDSTDKESGIESSTARMSWITFHELATIICP